MTAGNASGVNDGACAVIIASAAAVEKYGLTPKARIIGMQTAGVAPRIMGIGPAPASSKLMERLGLKISGVDVIELNEAFAAQGLAVTRQLGLPDDAEHVNPNGGAIALGHPLGMSGARLALTAATELGERDGKRALCTMCIGVGQGIALMLEKGVTAQKARPDGDRVAPIQTNPVGRGLQHGAPPQCYRAWRKSNYAAPACQAFDRRQR